MKSFDDILKFRGRDLASGWACFSDAGNAGGGGGGAGGEGGGDGGQPGGTGGSQGAGDGGDKGDKTYTQAELDAELRKVGAREKDQGKRAAAESLANELGVSVDEAKRIIGEHTAQEDKDKTDAQKAREAADAEKVKAEKEKADAALVRHETNVERVLIRAGLKLDDDDAKRDKQISRALKLVEAEAGADGAAIKAAVDDLKKDMPELFGAGDAGDGSGGGGAPNGDPKGGAPTPKGGEDAYKRGEEKAKERSTSRHQYEILNSQGQKVS